MDRRFDGTKLANVPGQLETSSTRDCQAQNECDNGLQIGQCSQNKTITGQTQPHT
jgi:hypothetical protein